jgi:hypothetical protein
MEVLLAEVISNQVRYFGYLKMFDLFGCGS